jgi:PIN domain nuclease of toxin-antitoxin system
VRDLLEDGANEVYYSAASIWEIAIKSSLGRKDFRLDPVILATALPDMGLIELPVSAAHAAGVSKLPLFHRDPFDRLLVAQSITEPLTLVSNDAILGRYTSNLHLV